MNRTIFAILAATLLAFGGCAPPTSLEPSMPSKDGLVMTAQYDGPFYPRVVATDDGRTLLVGGDTIGEGPPSAAAEAVIAVSKDGGHSWARLTFSAGRITGASVRGATLWVTADCSSRGACLMSSVDGGRSWQPRAVGLSVSPSLADPSKGTVLSTLVGGRASALSTSDAGVTFAVDVSLCGSDRSPVSLSLDGDEGVVACRTNGDVAVDYDDDWLLREHRGDQWVQRYDPPPASGPYDPNDRPTLSVSWVGWVTRRAGWALMSGGAGYYRSLDNGKTWVLVPAEGSGLPSGLWPTADTVASDGTGFGLVTSLSGGWWIVKTVDRGASFATVATFDR